MADFEMPTHEMSKADMLKRVARFKDLKPSKAAFIDTFLPGYSSETSGKIGAGKNTEEPSKEPAVISESNFETTRKA